MFLLDRQNRFLNPESIRDHQEGCLILLSYFHYRNKGSMPFELTQDAKGRQQLAKLADLNSSQIEFLERTWVSVQASCKC